MPPILPHEVAIKPIFIFNNEGTAEVIDIKGVICDVITIRGKRFDPSAADYATIGGITLKDRTISASTLTFNVADGVIDMGGATLSNVGGIAANPNDYRVVYDPFVAAANTQTNVASVTLPAGNVVATIYLTFEAMSSTGLTIVGQLGYRVKKFVGSWDFIPCGYAGVTSDDAVLNDVTILAARNGADVLLTFDNTSPLSLTVRVTATVTILRTGGI